MKRTPLKRGKSLRRKTWMRARSVTNSARRRVRDLEFMRWARRQACAAHELGGCKGRVEADHAGRRGIGQKADDRTCIPMCQQHHLDRAGFAGPFRAWPQEFMRAWLQAKIALCQANYAFHQRDKQRRA